MFGQKKSVIIKSRQAGFGALAYILLSIALLATITSALTVISRNNTNAQNNDVLVSRLYSQASKIRSDILLCMTETNQKTSGIGPAAYQNFPACEDTTNAGIQVNTNYAQAGYCSNVSTANPVFANARNLRCLAQNARSVWDESDGNFFPEPINGFEEWKYSIRGDNDNLRGVHIAITTADRTTNANTDWILRQVARRFGTTEAAVAVRQNGATGDTLNLGAYAATPFAWNASTNTPVNTLIVYLAK
jgi:hypothetical protein